MTILEKKRTEIRDVFEKGGDLFALAIKWREEGAGQVELYVLFLDFYELVNDEETSRIDDLAYVLDAISGWGNRSRWLFPAGEGPVGAFEWNDQIAAERLRQRGG